MRGMWIRAGFALSLAVPQANAAQPVVEPLPASQSRADLQAWSDLELFELVSSHAERVVRDLGCGRLTPAIDPLTRLRIARVWSAFQKKHSAGPLLVEGRRKGCGLPPTANEAETLQRAIRLLEERLGVVEPLSENTPMAAANKPPPASDAPLGHTEFSEAWSWGSLATHYVCGDTALAARKAINDGELNKLAEIYRSKLPRGSKWRQPPLTLVEARPNCAEGTLHMAAYEAALARLKARLAEQR